MFRVQTEININFDKNTWAVVKKKTKVWNQSYWRVLLL